MKVIEKAGDRTAYAQIFVEGRVQPLEEYGQYVDARDGAVCCYIAVEEGHKVRIDGRFSGVTLTVAYDFIVDGVCRKANSYSSKSVQVQKNKKLDFDKLLYQTSDGVIDTDVIVSSRSGPVILNKDAPETIGTIELRVYITRQFGVEHEIKETRKYDNIDDDADTDIRVASYKDVPPEFHLTFEKNCSTLDGAKGNRERRKVYAKRPGNKPWAIFRFHYRTKGKISHSLLQAVLTVITEAILGNNMELSFNTADKGITKQEPHVLELEPVPLLLLGSKPASKNDGESSVRTSSPAPSDTPSTPIRDPKKTRSAQPKVIVRKQQTKPTPATIEPTPNTALMTDTDTTNVIEPLTGVTPDVPVSKDLRPASTQVKEGSSTATAAKKTADNHVGDDALAAGKNGDGDLAAVVSKKSTKKVEKKTSASTNADADTKSKESIEKTEGKGDDKKEPEAPDLVPLIQPVEAFNVPKVPHPADLPSVFDTPTVPSTTAAQVTVASSTKDFVKNGTKAFTSPLKKATAKPGASDTAASMVLQKPVVSFIPAPPWKRAPEGSLTPPPDVKRIKTDIVPPLTPTHHLQPLITYPSPRPLSVEAQVAEQRKRLEATRKKRAEMAKQKAAIDEKLAPYKKQMAEKLERLRQETVEEEMMMAEEEEDYKASEMMLEECMRAGVGSF